MAVTFEIIKRIATIKDWGTRTLELNIVKWGKNPDKYDLRVWEGDIPRRGVTMTTAELAELFGAIGEELDLLFDVDDEDEEAESYEEDDESEVEEDDDEEESTYQEEIDSRSFFVYGNGKCNILSHGDQERVTAVIQILRKDRTVGDVEIDATYCPECNAYYISERDYLDIKKRGNLLCQVMSVGEYMSYKNDMDNNDLNPQSVLNMVGYTVNAKDNFSDSYRQEILTFAIESGIVTMKKAINTLSYLIKLNESRTSNRTAVEKWKRDLAFLNGHTPGRVSRYRAKILIIHSS